MRTQCVVETVRRERAKAPLMWGAHECTTRHRRRRTLDTAVQADAGSALRP